MIKQLPTLFVTNNELSPAVLRLVAGIIFAAYGAQKLFAWFGGYGLAGTGQFFDSIGLSPGYYLALLAGTAEFFGGLALIVGVLVRPAALALAVTMLIAIISVHLENGLFMANNGYAFALTLLAMSVALVFSGAGRFSLDQSISQRLATQH
jgi:putative oxidoreductase